MIGGDRNSITMESLSNLYPGVHQIVKHPTRKDRILDFFCTDLYELYNVPIIANPLEADDPTKAKPSDHKIPVIIPRTSENHTDVKKVVIKRPMPDSKLDTFEKWIFSELWEDLAEGDDVNEMTRMFTNKVQDKIDDIFPTKTI